MTCVFALKRDIKSDENTHSLCASQSLNLSNNGVLKWYDLFPVGEAVKVLL